MWLKINKFLENHVGLLMVVAVKTSTKARLEWLESALRFGKLREF